MATELLDLRTSLTQSQQKEKKSGSLVQELRAVVKEQKSRIDELIKAKKDAVTDLKVKTIRFGCCFQYVKEFKKAFYEVTV